MEIQKMNLNMLDYIISPAFSTDGTVITACNAAARNLLEVGSKIAPMVGESLAQLQSMTDGCLYLTLDVRGQSFGATAVTAEKGLLFLLDEQPESDALRALALAAREIRGPLNGLLSSLELLRSNADAPAETAMMERSINQILRIVGNMSDAGMAAPQSRQRVQELGSVYSEVFEKAAALAEPTGVKLTFRCPEEPMYTICDSQLLQRAALNLLSNALKFTPAGGSVHAELTRHGASARLCITDTGSGIARDLRSTLFRRYLRQPAIEESRFGMGLGLVIVRTAAQAHGGTVLIDSPGGQGTRVTMTMALRQSGNTLRSDIPWVDYSGGLDHTLVELSEVLPSKCYEH